MRPSAFDPPAIPPAFWERPDVCQALRKRDMGALFRLLRQYTGLSQMRIATAVGLGQGRISEVINGTRAIGHTRVFERIADGLDMPDHARILLGLSPRQITAIPRPRSITPARPGQDTELLRQITAARSIDGTVVRVLQGETDNIRLLDRRLGAPAVAGKLEAHISHIETGLRYSLRPGNREQLAVVLADASALAGWQAIDMGRLPRAWEHFERAIAAAREAGDACLLAFAAGEQAYVLLDLHRPAEALAMVRAAYEETQAAIPHEVRGWLRAAEAEMAAAAGEESTCRTALDSAAQGNRLWPGQRGSAVPRSQRDPSGPLARQLPGPVRRPADRRRPHRRARRDGRQLHPRRSKPALRPGRRPARPRRARRSQAPPQASPGTRPDHRISPPAPPHPRPVQADRQSGLALRHQQPHQRDQRPGVPDLPGIDEPRYRRERHPLHPLDLGRLGRLPDLLGIPADEHDVLGIHHADHRLKRDQVLNTARPVPRLFLQLPRRRLGWLLTLIDQPARKLPPPPVLHEPVTPQQQHPVLLVQQHHHRRPVQPHHVMPEPLPVRQLHIHLAQPHPRVVIDHPLAERLPPARTITLHITHTLTLTRPRFEPAL